MFQKCSLQVAVELSGGCDPQVAANAQRIYGELEREEMRFVQVMFPECSLNVP
jgi:hypothetical protein